MRAKHSGKFVLKQVRAASNGVTYDTFQLSGWLNGRRIRRHFKDGDEALGEKNRLEIEAANGSEIRVRATRLSAVQLAEAEAAISRLGSQPLSVAVDWCEGPQLLDSGSLALSYGEGCRTVVLANNLTLVHFWTTSAA